MRGIQYLKKLGDGFLENHFNMYENDIVVGIGYFMSKNYNEETKIENVLEHIDGMIDKI